MKEKFTWWRESIPRSSKAYPHAVCGLPALHCQRIEISLSPLTTSIELSSYSTKTHTVCRRCNARAFHRQQKVCASCGYPAAKIRSYEWGQKAKRRKTTGTGRMRYLKNVSRRAKNGFQTGTAGKKVAA